MREIYTYKQFRRPDCPTPNRKQQLVNDHALLVKRVAMRILRRLPPHVSDLEEEDLITVGLLGLFDADERFDPEAGYSFSSFAEFRIKGAMLDEIRKRDFFPRRLRADANKLKQAEDALQKSLEREPTTEELARAMSISIEQLQKLRDSVTPYRFVDQTDPTLSLQSDTPNPFKLLANKQIREQLVHALAALDERQQLVLDLYFNRELTLREIADVLDLTEGRISQLKASALEDLRKKMKQLSD